MCRESQNDCLNQCQHQVQAFRRLLGEHQEPSQKVKRKRRILVLNMTYFDRSMNSNNWIKIDRIFFKIKKIIKLTCNVAMSSWDTTWLAVVESVPFATKRKLFSTPCSQHVLLLSRCPRKVTLKGSFARKRFASRPISSALSRKSSALAEIVFQPSLKCQWPVVVFSLGFFFFFF